MPLLSRVDRPGSPRRPAIAPAIPEQVSGVFVTPPVACRRACPGKGSTMSAKPKPEPTDEAREQARRALQTSMDTRQ
ncbi:hypothetical protein Vqi01_20390 [Micromonospora qiuiae]|uniref:Uncharacterized protein n=1 Tax=Micromonospora qiuiae TaxID=502268 RepID=A0ABQ4J9Q5_9ACTN|nr:hypothetical protein Vqi01_20390 [Micromonospora qiuiae]